MTDRQCVEACVKGGEKYVFVGEGDKVYKIDNQDFAGLKAHAGHEVTVTGTMKDNAVTITKIEMPAATRSVEPSRKRRGLQSRAAPLRPVSS